MDNSVNGGFLINVPIAHGEVTLVTSDNAQHTLEHSARLAHAVHESNLNVLVVNCGMSDKRFRSHYYNTIGPDMMKSHKRVMIYSSDMGNLVDEAEALDQILTEAKVGVVILCGWEFAARGYRRKENLLYYLREMMRNQQIALVVYAHKANKPVAWSRDRGGVGDLSLLAYQVVKLDASVLLEEVVEKPLPIVLSNWENQQARLKLAQLVTNKINDLDTHGRIFTELEVLEEILTEIRPKEAEKVVEKEIEKEGENYAPMEIFAPMEDGSTNVIRFDREDSEFEDREVPELEEFALAA